MATYFTRDIKVGDKGDLEIGANGDLQVDDSSQSHRHLMKFLLATDFNELGNNPGFGSNIGSVVGSTSQRDALRRVVLLVEEGIKNQGIFSMSDVDIKATPVSANEIYIRVVMTGEYLSEDGTLIENPEYSLRYLFPYKDGELKEIRTG